MALPVGMSLCFSLRLLDVRVVATSWGLGFTQQRFRVAFTSVVNEKTPHASCWDGLCGVLLTSSVWSCQEPGFNSLTMCEHMTSVFRPCCCLKDLFGWKRCFLLKTCHLALNFFLGFDFFPLGWPSVSCSLPWGICAGEAVCHSPAAPFRLPEEPELLLAFVPPSSVSPGCYTSCSVQLQAGIF